MNKIIINIDNKFNNSRNIDSSSGINIIDNVVYIDNNFNIINTDNSYYNIDNYDNIYINIINNDKNIDIIIFIDKINNITNNFNNNIINNSRRCA